MVRLYPLLVITISELFLFSTPMRVCTVWTSYGVIYLAEKSHPDEPVPVEIRIPLLLNLPMSRPSTTSLYRLVQETSFSAAKTSFRQSLLIYELVCGQSISKRARVRLKYSNCPFSRSSKICAALSCISVCWTAALSKAPVRRKGSLLTPRSGISFESIWPAALR